MSEKLINSSFYERPNVEKSIIPIGGGVPIGFESVYNAELNIGGAYGSWGESYSNETLVAFVEKRIGEPLKENDILNLSELGFDYRQHIPVLSESEHLDLELEVGARLIRKAIETCGWQASEVEGVLLGVSGPIADDYLNRISSMAGVADSALKVSVHKACDGSMGALHLALNPELRNPEGINIADQLRGKKVIVGGLEGMSRFTAGVKDKIALQLFGNGMGAIGVIPNETIRLLVGRSVENYDEDGLLAVKMYYPHSRPDLSSDSLVDVVKEDDTHVRIAGLMHEPADGASIEMAGLMGMVKLFVRTGVQVVEDVYKEYRALMERVGESSKNITTGVVHHANFKINALKAKHLSKLGIEYPMPWLLNDFGNVSAASNMIAFLRQLPSIKLGDHILFDGFGAGTYYDVMAVSMGKSK
jgi:3-oxoacyl-[acyl-carrier-protein] synthase III